MAISDTITSMYDNVENVYDVLELAGADLTNVDKNIFNLKQSWEERLLYFLANGTDVVWNNWLPKVNGTGESITLSNTIQAKMDFVYKGNTSQTGTPTPDTPIPVQVVSGDNSITIANNDNTQSQTYPINLGDIELCKIGTYQDKIAKSTGKNLFNKDTIEEKNIDITTGAITDNNYWRLSDYISVIPSTNYMSSMINNTSNQFYVKVVYYDNTKTFISGVSSGFTNNQYYGFTTPNNAKYIRFAYIVIISDTPQNIDNIMINEGSTALPYEPYGKVWYLNKQIGKGVLDGSEGWYLTQNLHYQLTYSGASRIYLKQSGQGLTNYFEVKSTGTGVYFYPILQSGIDYLRIQNGITLWEDVATFKTWLSNHNTIFYYVLETPTTTEITDTTLISQLETIKKSYNTQTSISQVNNDLPFELDVVALGELD